MEKTIPRGPFVNSILKQKAALKKSLKMPEIFDDALYTNPLLKNYSSWDEIEVV